MNSRWMYSIYKLVIAYKLNRVWFWEILIVNTIPFQEECVVFFNHNQLLLLQERIALLDSQKGPALSFVFSEDFLQEYTGLFQIFLLLFLAIQSSFVWSVTVVSKLCVRAISCKRTARGLVLKQEAATRVFLFHLTLRESNLPIFKSRSFHIILNSKIKSYLSYLNSAFHTLETCVPSTDTTTSYKQAS